MNQKTKILALIPARMGSSRFPGKPMANILGKPMIGHVYDNVKKNNLITEIAVATCDDEIYNYIESIGGRAVMTSDKHERASDRCAEALLKIENENNTTIFEIAGTSERINAFIKEISTIVKIEVVRSGPIAISSLNRDEEV